MDQNKDTYDSGFRWGPFEIHDHPRHDDRRPLKIKQKDGCVYYPHEYPSTALNPKRSHGPCDVDLSKPIIMKGNHFEDFTHARDLDAAPEWYYWDNCLLPQFMDHPDLPQGKHWCRLVYRSAFPWEILPTEQSIEQDTTRINHLLTKHSQGRITDWQQIIEVRPMQFQDSKTVLLCESQANTLWAWYGKTPQEIRAAVQRVCDKKGLTLEVRPKPSRPSRTGERSLWHQLTTKSYHAVVCTHSAAAIEALCSGTPVVALGAHAVKRMSTSWQDFEHGYMVMPCREHILWRCQQLLTTVYHKDELLSGTWSRNYDPSLQEPYNNWSIDCA